MDNAKINRVTKVNKMRLNALRKKLHDYSIDRNKDVRLKKRWCRTCMYLNDRIGGAAITTKTCDECGESVVYSSTVTGAVCNKCSEKLGICAQCGGDIDEFIRT